MLLRSGPIVGIKLVNDDNDIMLITQNGIILRTHAKDISVLGRNTQGVTLMRTSDGGKVVSIAKIIAEDDDTEITE